MVWMATRSVENVGKGALAPGPLALCVVAAGLRNVDMCGAGSQVVWRAGRTVESVGKGAPYVGGPWPFV